MEEREIKRCICSKCGTKGEVIIFHRFGVEERRMAETGALFQWKCSSCGALYRFIYPCLYINDKKKLAVRYRGEGKDFDFALDLTGYCKRDCNSMEEISEKIRILETDEIAASASPRNPKVVICERSKAVEILLVA